MRRDTEYEKMIAPNKNKQDKVGAVLVIGGGIAGIQAALDLAESGQKVYLPGLRPRSHEERYQ